MAITCRDGAVYLGGLVVGHNLMLLLGLHQRFRDPEGGGGCVRDPEE